MLRNNQEVIARVLTLCCDSTFDSDMLGTFKVIQEVH